jgi:hypothetical protein
MILLTCSMYTSPSSLSPYSNFLLSIISKKYINNNYFKILQLRVGLTIMFYARVDYYQVGVPEWPLPQNPAHLSNFYQHLMGNFFLEILYN